MSPTPPPVAFSLSAPFAHAAKATRRHPALALIPVLVLLLPLIPLAGGVRLVLSEGGSSALQGLIAGAPDGQPGALILRPDLEGWLLLAALAALLATMLAVILAAGLVAGATGATTTPVRGRRGPSVPDTVREAVAVWPAMLVMLVLQLLLVTAVGAGVIVAATYAGRLQFQLPAVVLTLGFGMLLITLIRASLWPAIGVAEASPPLRSLRRSWVLSHKSVSRLIGAAITAFLAVMIPAAVVHTVIKVLLTQLAGQEVIGLSPLAIDLWALLPAPFAVFALSALWGREAPVLYRALVDFNAERPETA